MTTIILMTLAVYALIGVAVGFILSRNGITPYGLGQQYGKHYMKKQGLEEEETVNSWKKQ